MKKYQVYLKNWLISLPVRATAILLFFVAIVITVFSLVFYFKVNEMNTANSNIRIDRAARAASSILQKSYDTIFTIEKNDNGTLKALRFKEGFDQSFLRVHPELDMLVADISTTNQGAANLFKYNASKHSLDRFTSSIRLKDGNIMRVGGLATGHPAFNNVMAQHSFVGEVPLGDRFRLAYFTPILDFKGGTVGAISVDVGFIDDLNRAKLEMQNLIMMLSIGMLLAMSILGVTLLKQIFKPLKKISAYSRHLADGKQRGEVPYLKRDDEIGNLAKSISLVGEMKNSLEVMAYFDHLTGIPNRSSFLRELDNQLKDIQNTDNQLALFILDLDNFKEINDVLGHDAGDELLKEVCVRINNVLDSGSKLYRLGGDEFTIISSSFTDKTLASVFAQQVIDSLIAPFMLSQNEVMISGSIGITLLPSDANCVEDAFKNADLALYASKNKSKGKFGFYENNLSKEVEKKALLSKELRLALDNEDLTVFFQPQINPINRQISGVEALVRWNHKQLGFISPAEFIPVAEQSGLITDVGKFVLNYSCRVARIWLDNGFDFKHIAVNISPSQLWQPDFEESVLAALKRYRLDPHYLCLELTESVFINQAEHKVKAMLDRLRSIGVILSLDDFGTGYSSLSYLNQLPFDQLKVDSSFIRDVDSDVKKQRVFKGIAELGKGLGMQIVVEGVETPEEMLFVTKVGIDSIQGYFYSKPVEAAKLPLEINRIRFDEAYKLVVKNLKVA